MVTLCSACKGARSEPLIANRGGSTTGAASVGRLTPPPGCPHHPSRVARVADAIGESRAARIFICNLMTQPGETDGYDARKHLDVVNRYAPQIHFDFVVVNSRSISDAQAELYQADGAFQIGLDDDPIESGFGPETQLVHADLLDEGEMVRHNSERLARVVIACEEKARSRMTVNAE